MGKSSSPAGLTRVTHAHDIYLWLALFRFYETRLRFTCNVWKVEYNVRDLEQDRNTKPNAIVFRGTSDSMAQI